MQANEKPASPGQPTELMREIPTPLPEGGPVAGEQAPAAGQAGAYTPTTSVASQAAAPPPAVTPVDDTPKADDTSVADDVDVIEKEWVNRAKQVVARTKADPREQEKQVSKLQADYLKKRYGKEVKLSQED